MQRLTVSTTINGKAYSFEVEPRLLLVDLIRDNAGLTGTHVGCDTGNCGACTVLMDGLTVKSCQVLAPRAQGAEIRTVEGLAGDGKFDNETQDAAGRFFPSQSGHGSADNNRIAGVIKGCGDN